MFIVFKYGTKIIYMYDFLFTEQLLMSLKDKDTVVRWSAAKG